MRQFYVAISHSEDLSSPYDNFPFGCCQNRYLYEKGYISVEPVGGEDHGNNGNPNLRVSLRPRSD